jgi:hypothetical protein
MTVEVYHVLDGEPESLLSFDPSNMTSLIRVSEGWLFQYQVIDGSAA